MKMNGSPSSKGLPRSNSNLNPYMLLDALKITQME
jgi:hypothetical protein